MRSSGNNAPAPDKYKSGPHRSLRHQSWSFVVVALRVEGDSCSRSCVKCTFAARKSKSGIIAELKYAARETMGGGGGGGGL